VQVKKKGARVTLVGYTHFHHFSYHIFYCFIVCETKSSKTNQWSTKM